ncbi:MAG: dihydrofolate reductase [Verrucomicrobiota bacterium]|nr:dihydrofolate reductase [Verrucomicrobiota bacterium]
MIPFQAIAAMAENRVIGNSNRIPWHIPEDFKWFKAKTMGHILIMGRKTFESIGRPLPGRETIILSHSGYQAPGTRTVTSIDQLKELVRQDVRTPFICGGSEIYRQMIADCSDLFLTRVKGIFQGDVFFPEFETLFHHPETVMKKENFIVYHYQSRNSALVPPATPTGRT